MALREKSYHALEELQFDLDELLRIYNDNRTHQGKHGEGKTPPQTIADGIEIVMEKVEIGCQIKS